jgi:predicted 3-demethylubiquinone-9 3-methyltransferase (glyoxalase superfamily)
LIQGITPFLWFDDNAEEAVQFYTSIFKDSAIESISRYGEGGPGPHGQVMTATFRLHGQQFMALNGGPHFTFSPAISFFVSCETQAEIDELWDKLAEGGEHERCGWLTDKFGVTWQIVPSILNELLLDEDAERSQRTLQAMLQMDKLEIDGLRRAHAGD